MYRSHVVVITTMYWTGVPFIVVVATVNFTAFPFVATLATMHLAFLVISMTMPMHQAFFMSHWRIQRYNVSVKFEWTDFQERDISHKRLSLMSFVYWQ